MPDFAGSAVGAPELVAATEDGLDVAEETAVATSGFGVAVGAGPAGSLGVVAAGVFTSSG